MKSLTQHIYDSLNESQSTFNNVLKEALKVRSTSKVNIQKYNYHPKTRNELKELVKKLIEKRGNDADLNDIDTSAITDMSDMFYNSQFNGDISKWDVSNVETMTWMFYDSQFNGDISKWDVSNVEYMGWMFRRSKFNGDISKWDVSNVENMSSMFYDSKFNGDISNWDISNVKTMTWMFRASPLEKKILQNGIKASEQTLEAYNDNNERKRTQVIKNQRMSKILTHLNSLRTQM